MLLLCNELAIMIMFSIAVPRCYFTATAPVADGVLTLCDSRFRLHGGSGVAQIVSVFSRGADRGWLPSTRVLYSRDVFPACWAVNKGSL